MLILLTMGVFVSADIAVPLVPHVHAHQTSSVSDHQVGPGDVESLHVQTGVAVGGATVTLADR